MRVLRCSAIASLAAIAAVATTSPARAAELYLSGDLGISWFAGDGVGTNDVVGISNHGTGEDATPVYGGALGIQFPLNEALPWRMRVPGFGVPYWPGHELRFEGSDDVRFPDWRARVEVEHLRGRDGEMSTSSFNPLDDYRLDVKTWTVMGKFRLDVPVRTPVHALFGRRAPFLEPVTIYGGAGAGIAETDLQVSTGVLIGAKVRQRFSWQTLAGFGYQLNDHTQLSLGWRYLDFGKGRTQLVDSASVDRGRYSVDLDAHEFTASLTVWFWRLPPLLGDE